MIPDCQQRLEAAVHDLQSLVVRHPSLPPIETASHIIV